MNGWITERYEWSDDNQWGGWIYEHNEVTMINELYEYCEFYV